MGRFIANLSYTAKIVFLFLLIQPFSRTKAQDLDIKWSEEFTMAKTARLPQILASNNGRFYMLTGDDYGFEDMVLVKVSEKDLLVRDSIKLGGLKRLFGNQTVNKLFSSQTEYIEDIYIRENSILLIIRSGATNYPVLKAILLDTTGKLVTGPVLLAQTENISNAGEITHRYNEKTGDLLVCFQDAQETKAKVVIRLKLFNQKLEKTYFDVVELPYEQRLYTPLFLDFDNRFNLYMAAKVGDNIRDFKKGIFRYQMFRYNLKDRSNIEISIPFDTLLIASQDLTYDESGDNLLITGLYYSDKYYKMYAGVYQLKLDIRNMVFQSVKKTIFNKKLPISIMDQKKYEAISNNSVSSECKNCIPRTYKYQEIKYLQDGSYLLELEFHSLDVNGNDIIDTYRDNVLIKIDKNLDNEWINSIPKFQYCETRISSNWDWNSNKAARRNFKYRALLSYKNILFKKKYCVIFNETQFKFDKNANIKCMMAIVDENGNYEKKLLFSKDEVDFALAPLNSFQISNDKFLFFALNQKRHSFKIGYLRFQ